MNRLKIKKQISFRINIFFIMVIFCVLPTVVNWSDFISIAHADQQMSVSTNKNQISKKEQLNSLSEHCRDETLGVRFPCSKDWILHEGNKSAVFIVIAENPAVTLTVSKEETSLKFIDQITNDHLKVMGQYADGFRKELVKINNYKVIKVKAFSEKYPAIRLTDYYILNDSSLYGIFLSVNPKEEWPNYKYLLDEIIKKFELIVFEAEKPEASF